MFQCDEFMEHIDEYINDTLSDDLKSEMQIHMNECEACREEYVFAKNISQTLRNLPSIPVPSSFKDDLYDKLDIDINKSRKKLEWRAICKSWKPYSALAACILLFVLVKTNVWDMAEHIVPQSDPLPGNTIITDQNTAIPSENSGQNQAWDAVDTAPPAETETPNDVLQHTQIPTIKPSQKTTTKQSRTAKERTEQKQNSNQQQEQNTTEQQQTIPMPTQAVPQVIPEPSDKNKSDSKAMPALENGEPASIKNQEPENTKSLIPTTRPTQMPEGAETFSAGVKSQADAVASENSASGSGSTGAGGRPNSVQIKTITVQGDVDVDSILAKYSIKKINGYYEGSSSEVTRFLKELDNSGISYTSDISDSDDVVKFQIIKK